VTKPYISVVVPCYNESENLQGGVLDEMESYLGSQPYTYEVIISDDGSTDDSRELARRAIADKPRFRLQENPHGGKPSAVWYGIQAACGEIVLFTDMDQSTPIDQVSRLLPLFEQGYGVVIGSRGMERADFPLHRRIGSMLFRTFRRIFLLRSISDTQCGFKAMRAGVAREIFPLLEPIREAARVTGWKVTAFDVELLFLAERAGYRVGEVVVDWANRDLARGKRKSYLGESKEMAAQVLRVKLNDWRGVYDKPVEDQANSTPIDGTRHNR
jgi:glycosyltransferase involved in cell wall biosynthesis